jgi:hypothetical protein
MGMKVFKKTTSSGSSYPELIERIRRLPNWLHLFQVEAIKYLTPGLVSSVMNRPLSETSAREYKHRRALSRHDV